jgi:cobalt-precorrin-7 (C5)-methyltransferase
MAVNHNKLMIVGCGPGGPEYVTAAASRAVAQAHTVMGSDRLLRLFPDCNACRLPLPAAVEPAIKAVAEQLQAVAKQLQAGSVAVLVSGDPGLFSLAKPLVAHFGEKACEIIPAVSSLQVAFARLGLGWSDARIISAHGRIPQATAEELSACEKIAILGGTQEATSWVARLAERLKHTHALFVCENLTLPQESVREVRPQELQTVELSSLAIMIFVRRSEPSQEQPSPESMGG